jgi:cytochrome b subunit of formate dehydrogenase
MIISFLTLGLTGLTLRFSYTHWAAVISRLLGGFQTCGYLHRVAAVLMFVIFFAHLIDAYREKRRDGRSWVKFIFRPDSIMFLPQDLFDAIATVKWFLRIGPRPAYGRYTYWEKFDYFAVFWGVAIIGSTGLILWFPILFTRFLPGWLINIALIVHSDEALLATGFIFTIHFFNTHLRPEKFPMDMVIFTGQVPLVEMKLDKPREYEALVAAGKLEEHLAEPQPEVVVKALRVFGTIALVVGLSIAVWIIYAMAFASR